MQKRDYSPGTQLNSVENGLFKSRSPVAARGSLCSDNLHGYLHFE